MSASFLPWKEHREIRHTHMHRRITEPGKERDVPERELDLPGQRLAAAPNDRACQMPQIARRFDPALGVLPRPCSRRVGGRWVHGPEEPLGGGEEDEKN